MGFCREGVSESEDDVFSEDPVGKTCWLCSQYRISAIVDRIRGSQCTTIAMGTFALGIELAGALYFISLWYRVATREVGSLL